MQTDKVELFVEWYFVHGYVQGKGENGSREMLENVSCMENLKRQGPPKTT